MSFKEIHASLMPREGFSKDEASKNLMVYLSHHYVPKDRKDKTFYLALMEHARRYNSLPTIDTMKVIIPPEFLGYMEDIEKITPKTASDFSAILKATIVREVGSDFSFKIQDKLTRLDISSEDSLNTLISGISQELNIAQSSIASSALSTDVRQSGDDIKYRYLAAKENLVDVVYSGFNVIDDATLGIKPGELVFVAAPKKTGKTTFVLNWAYNAQVFGGYNIVYVSLEMQKETIERILHIIHSSNPELGGIPIKDREWKSGKCSVDQERYMDRVIEDYRTNKEYGQFHIISRRNTYGSIRTVADIERVLQYISNTFEPDLLIIDYPNLMLPVNAKLAQKDDYRNQIIREIQEFATGWNNSHGMPVICPHQINRTGEENGDKNKGVFTARDLADCHEVERASDLVLTLWRDEELRAQNRLVVGCIINRDNPPVMLHELFADYSIKRITNTEIVGMNKSSNGVLSVDSALNI